jgi:hypothetical protein
MSHLSRVQPGPETTTPWWQAKRQACMSLMRAHPDRPEAVGAQGKSTAASGLLRAHTSGLESWVATWAASASCP